MESRSRQRQRSSTIRIMWGDNYFVESDGEQRYQVIGMTRNLMLLLVVFVDRQADGEVIHLISARKAVDYEENIYNDQFR
jgi:uncharacterized DUF497 family protein